jgi:prepilin-type N-terminal cleavage/methylation domain-containing protein
MRRAFNNRAGSSLRSPLLVFRQFPQDPVRVLPRKPPRLRRAFTLIEFLVAIGVFSILLAIAIPYVIQNREAARRIECADHLRQIGAALQLYTENSGGGDRALPETVYDAAHKPNGYNCFTGPDDPNPFAKDTAVKPNDITASLWLLVRGGYIPDPGVFICPGNSAEPDRLIDAHGNTVSAQKRSNFRSSRNLSYSYASPFTDAFNFKFTSDFLHAEFAVIADQNPGVVTPPRDASPFDLASGNTRNHQLAGQNVLHAAGNVSFEPTPYCGVYNDNIFTVFATHRLTASQTALDTPGFIGPDLGPAYNYDSYLVPTAKDGF